MSENGIFKIFDEKLEELAEKKQELMEFIKYSKARQWWGDVKYYQEELDEVSEEILKTQEVYAELLEVANGQRTLSFKTKDPLD